MHPIKYAAIAAAITLTAMPVLAQEVTLRFQHFTSPTTANPTYFMQPWADAIEAQSDGRIKVEIYPFMQLGGAAPNQYLSLIHISEPTRRTIPSRMPSSA